LGLPILALPVELETLVKLKLSRKEYCCIEAYVNIGATRIEDIYFNFTRWEII
jgi:hypothetical protein